MKYKGITLIALVITIVILLILAGVTLNITLGENGIILRAMKAKENTEIAKQNEEKKLNELYSRILIATNDSSNITINIEDLKEVIKEEIKNNTSSNSNPEGTIISYMGNNAPSGYLACDGTEYNISEYKKLAEQIKTEFGTYNHFGGDGETTFAVPNLVGKFLKGNNSSGVMQEAGLPNITGNFSAYAYINGSCDGAFSAYVSNANCISVGTSTGHNFDRFNFNASRSSQVYGKSDTVTPENMSVLYCIKY